jgi:hypothetical protein
MLRAPMSRMDILTSRELKQVIDNSRLIGKYNEEIDRESAYEMLNEKIKKAEAVYEKEKTTKAKSSKSSSSRSTRQNPIIKVLTSATFIRSIFGILKKIIK